MPTRCRVCISENRSFIEAEMASGTSEFEVVRILKEERGEDLNRQSIRTHLKHLFPPSPVEPEKLGELLKRLEVEAQSAPPTVAAFYYILIQQMRSLSDMKADAGTAIKAAEAITRVTGMRQQQAFLLAYAQHHWNAPAPIAPVAPLQAELERVLDVD